MAAQNLWFYREQILRIVEESLEVSLVICNSELSEFTLAKIFDLFNQILPTGFVLNTGYWPFYNSLKKQSLCICARYGMDCRHFKHDHHWLDLESLAGDTSTIFSSRFGHLYLLNSETEVNPVSGGTAGYALTMKLTFKYQKIERGRPRRKKDENINIKQEQVIPAAVYSRFNIQREYYPPLHTIMFEPSPFFYETYGTYFPRLLRIRPSILPSNFSLEMNQRYYTTSLEQMPHFSLVLQHVNLPVYVYLRNMYAVYSHLEPPRIKKVMHSKGSQTEERENVAELWSYKELIGNLKPLWTDCRAPSYESLYSNAQARNVDYVFESFVMDRHVSEQCTITEIKDELAPNAIAKSIINGGNHLKGVEETVIKKEAQELPSSTVQDKDYDIQLPQWGYQKVVTRKRGRKKTPTALLYRDVLIGPERKLTMPDLSASKGQLGYVPVVLPNNETACVKEETAMLFENNGNPTYATVAQYPKAENNVSTETNEKVYETYKNAPDFQSFEKQFPDVPSFVSLAPAQINEHFDIAEEFIKEDMEEISKKGRKGLAK